MPRGVPRDPDRPRTRRSRADDPGSLPRAIARNANAASRAERLRIEAEKLEMAKARLVPTPGGDAPLTLGEAIGIASRVARGGGEPRDQLAAATLALKWQGLDCAPAKRDAPDEAIDAALEAYKGGADGLR